MLTLPVKLEPSTSSPCTLLQTHPQHRCQVAVVVIMAQTKLTAEEIAQLKMMQEKLQKAPKAGKIDKSKTINDQIKTIRILNLESKESTISVSQFPKIENINQGLFIVSDSDEELLFLIEFKQEIDLDSITFYAMQSAKEEYSPPKEIKIFKVDTLNKDFDDVKSDKDCTLFTIKKKKLEKNQSFKCSLKKKASSTVKFSKVTKLLIFIESNQDGTDQTYLNGIKFNGNIKDTTDMTKWEEVAAEARKRENQ